MNKHKNFRFPMPCRAARMILHIQLPILLLAAVIYLCSYLVDRAVNPLLAASRYATSLEYLAAALCISFLSALVAQLIEWDGQTHS